MLPLDAPPESGAIRFDVPVAPVSFQSSAARKAGVMSAVRSVVAPCEYLLSGDVKIVIQWSISERARYESDSSADVDNIVKPILDALSGPDGIMVDDCQVQELTCYWTGGYSYPAAEQLSIELRFDADAYFFKPGLLFLRIERGLYFPIYDDLPPDLTLEHADDVVSRFRRARELAARGVDAGGAHMILPIQRVFHRSKIGGFRTTTIEELRERCT